ncbi:MAG: MliC family protein [Alphaproteobacteria bacterium]
MVFAGDTATIVFADGKRRTLSRAISASGARYTDGSMTFWDRGAEGAFRRGLRRPRRLRARFAPIDVAPARYTPRM